MIIIFLKWCCQNKKSNRSTLATKEKENIGREFSFHVDNFMALSVNE
jgi:hypothetical protein